MLKIPKAFFIAGVALCIMFVAPSNAHADYTPYFGVNYSLSIADGEIGHGLGVNFAEIIEFDWGLKLFASVGFSAGLSDRVDLLAASGVSNLNMTLFSIPMRFGYPVLFDATEKLRIAFIPSFALDFLLENYTVYKYDLSGFGYSTGFSANLGLQHKIGRAYLWYGVDVEIPFFTFILFKGTHEYTAADSSTITTDIWNVSFITPADHFSIAITPFFCVGFKL